MSDGKRPPPSDDDATIMIPRPGSRRGTSHPPPDRLQVDPDSTVAFAHAGAARSTPAVVANDESLPAAPQHGVNPLVAAANKLLALVPQLRSTLNHPDPAGVRTTLLELITEFESEARSKNVSSENLLVARYVICTVIDEAASSTPWGSTGIWAQNSLLVTLHREGEGGAKFFQLLERMEAEPSKNINLLELMYACLALGFEGRYRMSPDAGRDLSAVRERLFLTIRRVRGEIDSELSPRWRGVGRAPRSFARVVPPWVVISGLLFLLFAAFLILRILLAQTSDPVQSSIASMRAPTATIERPQAALQQAPRQEEQKPRLKQFLLNEIAQGMLDVEEDARSSRVVLHSDAAFSPGSALVSDKATPILGRIADALNRVEGQIVVSGHTDNIPIRTLRFPSNFELSLARASAVQDVLGRTLTAPARMRHIGESDTRPLAPNDKPDDRARNRRVEILLRVAG